MKQIDLVGFHRHVPFKYTSDGAFLYKYYFDERGESFFTGINQKDINAFRNAANNTLLNKQNKSNLQHCMSKSRFPFCPFLAVVYDLDNDAVQVDAWIKSAKIIFKQIYTLSHAGDLETFMDSATQPYFILPYHIVEMLKNEAEWTRYELHLNFNILTSNALKKSSKYIFSNHGAFSCLTNYQSSSEPIQHHEGLHQPFSIHGLTAFKLYQAITNQVSNS